MAAITTEPLPAFITTTTMNTNVTNNFNVNGNGGNGNAVHPMYLLSNQDFIMAQQRQQQQQAAASGNLPAPISSESSLNSSTNASVSSHVSASSPVPAPNAGMQLASAGGLTLAGAPTSGNSQFMQLNTTTGGIQHQVSSLQSSQPATSNTLANTALTSNNPIILNTATTSTNQFDITNQFGTTNPITAAAAAQALLPGGSVPEFLYQLTKMLTDPNRDIIEWSTYSGNGRIEVHNPARLEKEVLGRYFRHSKYSSFQRQLNYFGFRKIAGKGKMSPCSYINDNATTDIRCLLLMKRKNSKEKERELAEARERELLNGNVNGSGASGNGVGSVNGVGGADNSESGNAGGGMNTRSQKKRRVNPGDEIQPATVRPMFNAAPSPSAAATVALSASHASAVVATGRVDYSRPVQVNTNNEVFNSMAANIARNIRQQQQQSQHPTAVSIAASRGGAAAAKPSTDGRGYTVAIGKGVRHQLNGYLRANGTNTTTASSSASARLNTLPTTTLTATTSAPSTSSAAKNSTYSNNYLTHPSSKLASLSAPAPLQFLDPSELGMSIENSLSQLKDNFALATANANTASAGDNGEGAASAAVSVANSSSASSSASTNTSSTAASNNSASGSNQRRQQANGNNNVKYAPSSLTRRVSSHTFLGGMLSRDDSLINLAMLPTLDSVNNSADGDGGSSNVDLSGGIFSRNDSLLNLAAAVEAVSNGTATTTATGGAQQTSDNGDTFGFIDFQS